MARCKCTPVTYPPGCGPRCKRDRLRHHYRQVEQTWLWAGELPPESEPQDVSAAQRVNVTENELWDALEAHAACETKKSIERRLFPHITAHNGKLVSCLWRDSLGVETQPPAPQTVEIARLRAKLAQWAEREAKISARLVKITGQSATELFGPPPTNLDDPPGAHAPRELTGAARARATIARWENDPDAPTEQAALF